MRKRQARVDCHPESREYATAPSSILFLLVILAGPVRARVGTHGPWSTTPGGCLRSSPRAPAATSRGRCGTSPPRSWRRKSEEEEIGPGTSEESIRKIEGIIYLNFEYMIYKINQIEINIEVRFFSSFGAAMHAGRGRRRLVALGAIGVPPSRWRRPGHHTGAAPWVLCCSICEQKMRCAFTHAETNKTVGNSA